MELTVELPLIPDALTLMRRHCNVETINQRYIMYRKLGWFIWQNTTQTNLLNKQSVILDAMPLMWSHRGARYAGPYMDLELYNNLFFSCIYKGTAGQGWPPC